MRLHTPMRRRLFTAVLLCLPAFVLGGGTVRGDSSPAFSGQATVVRATLPVAGTIVLADTGPLPQSGGALNASLLDVAVPNLLTAEVGHASTIGQGDRSRSAASVARLAVTAGGNTVEAEFLRASAVATCAPGGGSASGQSELAALVINGQQVVVSGAPNQTVMLPGGGEVIINEQNSNGPGDITVNALHVIVPGVADVVIASAHADITCPGPPPQPPCAGSDFVTGGGWIVSPSGGRANFAVAGGLKNGALSGHLQFIDHGAGPRVKGTGVTAYVVTGPSTRHIEGTADIDNMPGRYQVDVADNGEPGHDTDAFSLTLSTGYTASGLLGGGNIQLHSPCR